MHSSQKGFIFAVNREKIMRRIVRETAFRLVRSDVIQFIEEHEQELFSIFREEMQRLDDDMPEEKLFIDIHMVPLGEELLKAALNAIKRFLVEV
jgi:tRNA(Phe) wybutosine-synthesizing methylase Tyw3